MSSQLLTGLFLHLFEKLLLALTLRLSPGLNHLASFHYELLAPSPLQVHNQHVLSPKLAPAQEVANMALYHSSCLALNQVVALH